jgi:hypothetical protein
VILYRDGRVTRGEYSERIERWEVWFQTPFGLTPKLHEAVEACVKGDFDPELMVVPVPVAMTQASYEVAKNG